MLPIPTSNSTIFDDIWNFTYAHDIIPYHGLVIWHSQLVIRIITLGFITIGVKRSHENNTIKEKIEHLVDNHLKTWKQHFHVIINDVLKGKDTAPRSWSLNILGYAPHPNEALIERLYFHSFLTCMLSFLEWCSMHSNFSRMTNIEK